MKGEYFFWHVLAEKLGRTVQEAQNSVTSTEFIDWMVFEEMRLASHKPEHFYLGRLAMEVRAIFHKNPKSLKLEDFLLDFSRKAPDDKITQEKELMKSKSIWANAARVFGFKPRQPERIP